MNSNAKRGLAEMVALALSQAVRAMTVNTAARSGVNSAASAALTGNRYARGANVVTGPLNWDEKSDLKGFSLAFLSGRSTGR
ncbi:hypothetical protein [Cronobacter malonaticus]|uniref:hypothetical protein n=1 Tax=Cronobacter malonaticus TaxID=413503 RepID=UPI000CFD92E4|nr:hypothetical protein [Cronobacter malonaticus]ELY2766740.1 hypothetical protein [Cronobacter malonaticus]MDI7689553.1 hypothetical protein [Cronobacter malonaticus]MDK1301228.1 hypothetical protein [Cronobacter malonaticus]NCH85311.1 hypothetical protein [Cronobacter malonaticus]